MNIRILKKTATRRMPLRTTIAASLLAFGLSPLGATALALHLSGVAVHESVLVCMLVMAGAIVFAARRTAERIARPFEEKSAALVEEGRRLRDATRRLAATLNKGRRPSSAGHDSPAPRDTAPLSGRWN